MENLRPNKQRAKIAILLIGIVMFLDIVSLISSYFQYNLLNDIAKGVNVSIATADTSELRESIIAVIYVIAFLISGITFIQWFRRAYFNLHLRVDNLKFGEGWAAGSWFTPIISIYRPFQIMKELYEKTNELLLSREGEEGSKTNYSNFTLAIWWTLWLIDNYFGQIIFRASLNDKTNQLNITSIMSMIESLIGVILGLITIKIIRDYSMMEEKLAHQDHYYSN
jgi:hypothetical protein